MLKNTKQIPLFKDIFQKSVEMDFNGGDISSDCGLILLRQIESEINVIKQIVDILPDDRHPSYVRHVLSQLVSQRVYQICAGYEDGNDCNAMKSDPIFKMLCGKKPQTDDPLASQPTMSRFENSLSRSDLYRIAISILDHFIESYKKPPKAIILDFDDTDDPTHGAQQLSLFNGYYDEYCYQPMHIYEGKSGKLVATILRPGKRPSGDEIVSILKRLVARIRKAWPEVQIVVRGDSHYSSAQMYEYCEAHNVKYLLGFKATKPLQKMIEDTLQRAIELYHYHDHPVKIYNEFQYQAAKWLQPHRVIVKVEYNDKGSNVRCIITNLTARRKMIYETAYCGRGAMELMIKEHKNHLASDRLSCTDFGANQFRLFLHSIAYVLMHAFREKMLKSTAYATAQFDTIRLKFLKVGARIIELKTKIKIHVAGSYPLKDEWTRMLIAGFA